MASIVSRGNEKYAVVYYEGRSESKRQIWKSGFTLKEALKFKEQKDLEAKQERAAVQKQKPFSAGAGVTLKDFMGNFVESYGRKRWGASYYSSSLSLLENYIFPYLGHYELAAITTKDIDDYYSLL